MKVTTVLEDEAATVLLGSEVGTLVCPGSILFLQGELGAGKTTFVRGFLQGLGFQGKVKSPTFTIVEEYDLENALVYHFDLYRLIDPEELEFIGIYEYFTEEAIVLVEWPEKGIGVLPKPDAILEFTVLDQGRSVTIQSMGERGATLLSTINKLHH